MTKVSQEMTRRVVYVLEHDDLAKAYTSMKAMGIRHIPVTKEGRVVGMLSDRDVLAHSKFSKNGNTVVPELPVSEVMSSPVYSCREEDSIGKVADMMLAHQIDSVAVVDPNNKLIGMITSTDLIRLLRDQEWSFKASIPYHFVRTPLLAMA